MVRRSLPLIAIAVLTVPAAWPQGGESPSRVIRILREEIRQGRRAAYERQKESRLRALARTRFPVPFLTLSSVSGPEQVWFVEEHASFAQMEEVDAAVRQSAVLKTELDGLEAAEADLRSSREAWLGVLRPELSYRADAYVRGVPQFRFMSVGVVRVRPGRDREFGDLARAMGANYAKAKDERPYLVYQIVSGTATGTYILFAPMLSMRGFDEAADRSRALRDAVGEDRMREASKETSEHLLGTESLLFAIVRDLSYSPAVAPQPVSRAPKGAPAKPANSR